LKQDVARLFKIEDERPDKYAHYRGIMDFWAHCEKENLEKAAPKAKAKAKVESKIEAETKVETKVEITPEPVLAAAATKTSKKK